MKKTLFVLLPLLCATSANASLLLEPMAGATAGTSSLTGNGSSAGFSGGGRFGIEREDLFSAFEANYTMIDLSGLGTGNQFTFGVTAGGTLTYAPFRVWLGFDFANSYSSTAVSLGGSAFRAGIGYYLLNHFLFNVQYTHHNFTGVQSTSPSISTSNARFGAFTVSVSIPMIIDVSDKPWRAGRQVRNGGLDFDAPPAED